MDEAPASAGASFAFGTWWVGHRGLAAKGAMMYGDLLRIPSIVRPPRGLGDAHRSARAAALVDLVPTIVRMCGGQPDDMLQGMNCSDSALGSDTKANEEIVAEFHSVK